MAPIVADMTQVIQKVQATSRYFSVIDLANCFFAIPLHPDSQDRFAFTIRDQQYTFQRLPQGFQDSPAIAHRHVVDMLDQLSPADRLLVFSYVDDILVFGELETQVQRLTEDVLTLIQDTGFKVSLEKAQLVQTQVSYLGIIIGQEGRQVDQRKVRALIEMPAPTDVHSLRVLLGGFNFLRPHIYKYAEITLPLWKLLKKKTHWEWGPDQDTALNTLKQKALTAPALRFPDESKPFVIRLAANEVAMAATLLQQSENQKLVPVAYESKKLQGAELNFNTCERECLTAVWAVQSFEPLTGSAPITIQSTHTPLKYILSGKLIGGRVSNTRMAQWTLTLVNRGVWADTVAKPDMLTHALIERGTKHECPLVTLEQRIMQAQAPPLEELDTVGRERHIWFRDGSSMVIHGKKRIRYAAINLEEEVLTGYLDHGSAQHAELHAIYQVLKQYAAEECPKTVYIYADSNYCVNGVQYWMFDWQKNGWKAADGKEIAYIEEWKWIYAWVTSHPDQLKIKHVKAHGKGSAAETIWNNRADAIARDYEGIAAVT